MEFIGTVLRVVMNSLAKSWSDMIAKIIKGIAQIFFLDTKVNKKVL